MKTQIYTAPAVKGLITLQSYMFYLTVISSYLRFCYSTNINSYTVADFNISHCLKGNKFIILENNSTMLCF